MTTLTQFNNMILTSDALDKASKDSVKESSYFDLLDMWSSEIKKMSNIMGMNDFMGDY